MLITTENPPPPPKTNVIHSPSPQYFRHIQIYRQIKEVCGEKRQFENYDLTDVVALWQKTLAVDS